MLPKLKLVLILISVLIALSAVKVQADWSVDLIAPNIAISPLSESRMSQGDPITLTCTDSLLTDSGCLSITYRAYGQGTSGSSYQTIPNPTSAHSFFTILTAPVISSDFNLLIEYFATDRGGNSSNGGSSQTAIYIFRAGTPWIQTTAGDVHSNTNIRTPGGP